MKMYRFGDFQLDTHERKIIKKGGRLAISVRAFDILEALVEKSGEVITKDELIKRVWQGAFIEESNIAVHISKLRKMLGASASEPFIETAPGVGYRFVKRVETIEAPQNGPGNGRPDGDSSREKADSIAVIPFRIIEGPAEMEYLADGLTEGFINGLSSIPDIIVVPRDTVFRFRDSELPAREIGEKLRVNKVLAGRLRFQANRMMVGVELISVKDNSQIWGTQINQDFSKVFDIQEEIIEGVSQNLVSQLKAKVSSISLKEKHGNQESYRSYLKGAYFLLRDSHDALSKALLHFHEALRLHPMNMAAYAGLINTYNHQYFIDVIDLQGAIARVEPLIATIPRQAASSPEIECALGSYQLYLHWDFAAAEGHFREALNLWPDFPTALFRYAQLLLYSGRFSEALEMIHKVREIDVFSPHTIRQIATSYLMMGQIENAVSLLKEAIEIDPNDWRALIRLSNALSLNGQYDEALSFAEETSRIKEDWEIKALKGYIHAKKGSREKAEIILNEMLASAASESLPDVCFSYLYIGLGNIEKAFEHLEKAFALRYNDLIMLKVDPRWIPIRQDPRFLSLMGRIGIPD